MKKNIVLTILTFCIFSNSLIYAATYLGAGASMLLPQNKMKEFNQEALGLNLLLETRHYCNLWYGLKLDFFSLDPKTGISDSLPYFKNAVFLSPQIRYNFLYSDCYNNKIIPYLQAMFTVSSMGANDSCSRFGLGGGAGAGITMGFTIDKHCLLLDLGAQWSAPNSIYRADGRNCVQTLLLNATLSISL